MQQLDVFISGHIEQVFDRTYVRKNSRSDGRRGTLDSMIDDRSGGFPAHSYIFHFAIKFIIIFFNLMPPFYIFFICLAEFGNLCSTRLSLLVIHKILSLKSHKCL